MIANSKVVQLILMILTMQVSSYNCAWIRNSYEPITKKITTDGKAILHEDVLEGLASNIKLKMNEKISPCDNFYEFACGEFLKSANIPKDEKIVDSFSVLEKKINEQTRKILEEPIKPNEPKFSLLAKNLYKSCIIRDAQKIRKTLMKTLKKLGGWPVIDGKNWNATEFNWIESIHESRNMAFYGSYFLSAYASQENDQDTKEAIYLTSPYFVLDRTSSNPSQSQNNTRKSYIDSMVKIAVILGADRTEAQKQMEDSDKFEEGLAALFRSENNQTESEERMSFLDFQAKYPSIPWKNYLHRYLARKEEEIETMIVIVPEFMENWTSFMSQTSNKTKANYMMWRIVQESGKYLDDQIHGLSKAFKDPPTNLNLGNGLKQKICQDFVQDHLSYSLDGLYIRKYYNNKIEPEIIEIGQNIRSRFVEIMKSIKWMNVNVKNRAIEKLEAILMEIGYDKDHLSDLSLGKYYHDLEIREDDYLQNAMNLRTFEGQFEDASNITDPFHEILRYWTPMAANAYYAPVMKTKASTNKIQIPAGILQGPFFDIDRPQYMNYGGIGIVIGHELTHAFDDDERNYDSKGKFHQWDNKTEEAYWDRVVCLVDQYDGYTVTGVTLKLKGKQTQSENIADNGGIIAAYRAYVNWLEQNIPEPTLPGLPYSPKQMFWISAASAHCSKFEPEALKNRIAKGGHSPAEFRIIGSFSNMLEFAKDFQCFAHSDMNPMKKCHIV